MAKGLSPIRRSIMGISGGRQNLSACIFAPGTSGGRRLKGHVKKADSGPGTGIHDDFNRRGAVIASF